MMPALRADRLRRANDLWQLSQLRVMIFNRQPRPAS